MRSLSKYSIKEEKMIGEFSENTKNYDLMTAIVICLGDAEDTNTTGILKLLEVLLSSERNAEEKKTYIAGRFFY